MTSVYSLGNGTVDRIGALTKSGLEYIDFFRLNNNSTIHFVFLSELKLNTTVSILNFVICLYIINNIYAFLVYLLLIVVEQFFSYPAAVSALDNIHSARWKKSSF
jgi:hypothetical protein